VLRHVWEGTASCPAAETYRQSLPTRFRAEADTLRELTGWQASLIHARMEGTGEPF